MRTFIRCFIVAMYCSPSFAFCACDKDISSSRFTLNEGEAFDQQTNLTWSRCSLGTRWQNGKCVGTTKLMSLNEASEYAQQLGGGWRVPSIEELYSIVEHKCSNPTINSVIFPGVKDLGEGAPYWSTTEVKEMPSLIYYIDFLSGEADAHTKGFAMAVRLVHGNK